jgi:DEAD/DEAH box helicase domain-containing protein
VSVVALEAGPVRIPGDAACGWLDGLGWTEGSGAIHVHRLPSREGVTGTLRRPLPSAVHRALGVEDLWSHQAEALDLIRTGVSTAVASGTGSGKSLIYQAAIAEASLRPVRAATALLLFPTKALAQDQARALRDLGLRQLVAATYDGDCSNEERAWARNRANVVLTNPEMLHHGILPNHRRWAGFLSRLAYVVIDELHTLRGIFGSHVAHVLRRLRRLCASYGATPTFIFSSATIGQPARLASELCGLPVRDVVSDGSPRAERVFALWNPPLHEGAGRVSAATEATAIGARLVSEGRRILVFTRSRRSAEVIAADLRRRVRPEWRETVCAYRGGYLPEERREVEEGLFSGQLRGVVTTSALELGIDAGSVDATVLAGFPGTVASMWQQAGRAGRDGQASLAVLVAGDDQLDQWFTRNPTQLFTRAPEPAVINPANPYVLLPHLECAAFERPLGHDDERFWGDLLAEGVRLLVGQERLKVRSWGRRGEPSAAWTGSGWPSQAVGLRSASRREVSIRERAEDQRLVGTVDEARAPALVHPGAVYLHRGAPYRVIELDLEEGVAWVEPDDGDTYTVPRTSVSFRIVSTDRSRSVGRAGLSLGTIEVSSRVGGFQRFESRTRVSLGVEPLDLPPSTLLTRGLWYTLDNGLVAEAGVSAEDLPAGLHALEHAAIGLLPLFTICDRWDVGGVSTALQADTQRPTITIYDGYPGGAGIAELAYDFADRHLQATAEHVSGCGCEAGCPSCIHSPKCGNGNETLDKAAALALVRAVLAPLSAASGPTASAPRAPAPTSPAATSPAATGPGPAPATTHRRGTRSASPRRR